MGWGALKTPFLALAVAWSIHAPADQHSTRYDVTALAEDGYLTLLGGKRLPLPGNWHGGRIVFEDLKPGANWAHPAKLWFIGQTPKISQNIDLSLPPRDLLEARWMSGPNLKHGNVEFHLTDFGGVHRVKTPARYWALLINGSGDHRHWNDFSFLYRVLTKVYGYLPSQILVLDSVYQRRLPDLDGDGAPDIQYGSTLSALKGAFSHLTASLKKDDRLLLVVNDHGGRLDNESTIYLYDAEIKASEFVSLMKGIAADEVIAVYQQCHGGGFLRPTMGPHRVGVAAALDTEISYASLDLRFDEFLFQFISAIAWQKPNGTPVQGDLDGDGRVSIKEAFVFAHAADKAPESPALESFTNSGKAMTVGIGF